MATSIIRNELALNEYRLAGTTNIKGFSMTVAPQNYRFVSGLIFSRRGVNAFTVTLNYAGAPAADVAHIVGEDAITATASGQTVNFVASTTWNDFKILYSTTITEITFAPIAGD